MLWPSISVEFEFQFTHHCFLFCWHFFPASISASVGVVWKWHNLPFFFLKSTLISFPKLLFIESITWRKGESWDWVCECAHFHLISPSSIYLRIVWAHNGWLNLSPPLLFDCQKYVCTLSSMMEASSMSTVITALSPLMHFPLGRLFANWIDQYSADGRCQQMKLMMKVVLLVVLLHVLSSHVTLLTLFSAEL